MRLVQYQILTQILEKVKVPDYVFAFEKGKSIPSLAQLHVGKEVVVSLDIKDFFPSIKQWLVEEMFNRIGYWENAGRTLSEICTYSCFLPQGAITSPKIANIVTAMTFGPPLKAYADRIGATMTIYADDITLSLTKTDLDPKEIMTYMKHVIQSFGFRVNHEKDKIMRKSMRHYVCGVVVNDKTNLIRTERRKLRAIVQNCKHNGLEAEAAKNNMTGPAFYSNILGKLNWYKQLNPVGAEPLIQDFKMFAELYRNLEHASDTSTLVVTEGVEITPVQERVMEIGTIPVPVVHAASNMRSDDLPF